MPESRKTSSSSSSPASKKPSKIPVRVEARPETKRSTRDTDELPAFDFDPLSPVPADVASRRREAESAPTLLHERFSFQAPGEEELRAVADVRELHDSEIDSPLTPGTPAIDLVPHLHNQAERIVAERGLQITLPFRFKHPQPDDVIPYQQVAEDGSVRQLRDGEWIVLARREGSERVVKGKDINVVRGVR